MKKASDYFKYEVVSSMNIGFYGTDDLREARYIAKQNEAKVYRLDDKGYRVRELKVI